MKRVTGIGGIFFKCVSPQNMLDWYDKHLGIPCAGEGAIFQWKQKDSPDEDGHTVWGPFESTTRYFDPSKRDFMINYRVDDLDGLLQELRKDGVEVVGEVEKYDYGKFAWILDPEGNKIELWEPIDEAFRKANGLDR